jgi:thioesterase domain-containing protein
VFDNRIETVVRGDDASWPELVNAGMEHAIPAMHRLGIRVVELCAGRAVATVPLTGNSNHLGTLYAGALFGVAEMLGGALFFPSFDATRFYPTVKELHIRFQRPATTDIRAEASMSPATIQRLTRDLADIGKAEFILESILTDAAGQVVAATRGTYQIRTR